MAKLYFRYGAMNSGKSTALLQAAHNYEERGQRILLAKPSIDSRGQNRVVSRLGVSRAVDFLIPPEANLLELFERAAHGGNAYGESPLVDVELPKVSCLLVDEAQFLPREQVDDLLRIAVLKDVPVLAYGIRTDFLTHAFPGASRLLEIAHTLEELKTICRCGRKAVLNGRRLGDQYVFSGDQVAMDGEAFTYESLCAACYLRESGGKLG